MSRATTESFTRALLNFPLMFRTDRSHRTIEFPYGRKGEGG